MVPKLNSYQTRIYANAALLTEYTFDEMVELAKEFDADTDLGTVGSLIAPEEAMNDAIQGLCEYGYFTPSVVSGYGYAATDLDDWRFEKVASPPSYDAPAPTVTWVIPFSVQGDHLVGVAP